MITFSTALARVRAPNFPVIGGAAAQASIDLRQRPRKAFLSPACHYREDAVLCVLRAARVEARLSQR
jgi:hypothetical protein